MNLKKLQEYLSNKSPEELKAEWDEMFPPENDPPKGWISIEEHLPMMYAMDIEQGYSEFKIKYKNGNEGVNYVSDGNTWYHYAKKAGITHWFNN